MRKRISRPHISTKADSQRIGEISLRCVPSADLCQGRRPNQLSTYYPATIHSTNWSKRLPYLTISSIKHKGRICRLAPSRWRPRHRNATLLPCSLPDVPLGRVQQSSTQVLIASRNSQDVPRRRNIGKDVCEEFDRECLEEVTPRQCDVLLLGLFFCRSVCPKTLLDGFL